MRTETFTFDCFNENFTLLSDFTDLLWPEFVAEIDYVFHGAEPDVGIFHEQYETRSICYYIGGDTFNDEDDFVNAVYCLIESDIVEDEQFVAQKIRDQVSVWEAELEQI